MVAGSSPARGATSAQKCERGSLDALTNGLLLTHRDADRRLMQAVERLPFGWTEDLELASDEGAGEVCHDALGWSTAEARRQM